MNYRKLFHKLERTLDDIDRSEDLVADLSLTVQRLVDDFHDDLGLERARIYAREGNDYVLQHEYPSDGGHQGFRIPATYAPIREMAVKGFVLHDIQDPGVDRQIEDALGVDHFASIAIGNRDQYIIAFTLSSFSDPDHIVYLLNTIRHVIRLKFREVYFQDRLAQTREIQMSLLPRAVPDFREFDIWSETVPAEEVGGDLYDYIRVSERVLGLAIMDSAGHGLPAALQARDAIIGLRMGVEERMRITATVEKLNRVVSHSALSSKFISLFFGELESDGMLAYCNAGHVPPLLWADGEFNELSVGGLLLGPNPDARYRRGFATLEPGAVLVMYTDGITEARNPEGEMFETRRLREIVASRAWDSARTLVETVFSEVRRFSSDGAPEDDQTVTVVIRG